MSKKSRAEETVKLILPYLTIDQKFLLYVLDNISPVFGLSQSNWVMEGSAGY